MVPVRGWCHRAAGATLFAAPSFLALGCGGQGATVPVPPTTTSAAATAGEDVEIAVNWLEAHQSADGGWEAAGFHRWQMGAYVAEGGNPDAGKAHNDVAVTALATLRHLLLGYGPRAQSPSGAAVAWGLHALCGRQRADGCVSDPSQPLWATNHALASWALAEAAAADAGDATLDAARRALTFLSSSLAGGDDAWRTERGPADLPPLGWATRAYAAAREADRRLGAGPHRRPALVWDQGPLERARAEVANWVAADSGGRTLGRVGAGLLARAMIDPAWKEQPEVAAALAWLDDNAPVWDPTGAGVDLAGWYLAAEARQQGGGEGWRLWDMAIKRAVVDQQHTDGDFCVLKGSWDPIGVWGAEGGRVFATAACQLICLVYYRYDVVDTRAQGPAPVPPAPPPVDPLPERSYPPCR